MTYPITSKSVKSYQRYSQKNIFPTSFSVQETMFFFYIWIIFLLKNCNVIPWIQLKIWEIQQSLVVGHWYFLITFTIVYALHHFRMWENLRTLLVLCLVWKKTTKWKFLKSRIEWRNATTCPLISINKCMAHSIVMWVCLVECCKRFHELIKTSSFSINLLRKLRKIQKKSSIME